MKFVVESQYNYIFIYLYTKIGLFVRTSWGFAKSFTLEIDKHFFYWMYKCVRCDGKNKNWK